MYKDDLNFMLGNLAGQENIKAGIYHTGENDNIKNHYLERNLLYKEETSDGIFSYLSNFSFLTNLDLYDIYFPVQMSSYNEYYTNNMLYDIPIDNNSIYFIPSIFRIEKDDPEYNADNLYYRNYWDNNGVVDLTKQKVYLLPFSARDLFDNEVTINGKIFKKLKDLPSRLYGPIYKTKPNQFFMNNGELLEDKYMYVAIKTLSNNDLDLIRDNKDKDYDSQSEEYKKLSLNIMESPHTKAYEYLSTNNNYTIYKIFPWEYKYAYKLEALLPKIDLDGDFIVGDENIKKTIRILLKIARKNNYGNISRANSLYDLPPDAYDYINIANFGEDLAQATENNQYSINNNSELGTWLSPLVNGKIKNNQLIILINTIYDYIEDLYISKIFNYIVNNHGKLHAIKFDNFRSANTLFKKGYSELSNHDLYNFNNFISLDELSNEIIQYSELNNSEISKNFLFIQKMKINRLLNFKYNKEKIKVFNSNNVYNRGFANKDTILYTTIPLPEELINDNEVKFDIGTFMATQNIFRGSKCNKYLEMLVDLFK